MNPSYLLPEHRAVSKNFARATIAKGLNLEESAILKRWQQDAPEIQKALVGSITSTDVSPDEGAIAREFFESVSKGAIIGRLPGLRKVPFLARMLSMSQGATGYWVSQASPKPISRPTLDGSTLLPLKVAAICVFTKDSLMFSEAESLFQTDLQRALIEVMDEAFISASNAGTPGEMPSSITNAAPSVASIGDPQADLNALIELFTGNLDSAALVCDPTTAAEIALYRDAGGSYPFPDCTPRGGSVLGFPLIVSRASPRDSSGGQIAIVDPTLISFASEGIRLEKATQTDLLMADDPSGPAELVSLWQTNSIAIRVELQANWEVMRAGAVAYLTGASYAGQP